MFIKLRKLIWLPIKYKLQKKRKIHNAYNRTPVEIENLYDKISEELLRAQRQNNVMEEMKNIGKIEIINWFMNDDS